MKLFRRRKTTPVATYTGRTTRDPYDFEVALLLHNRPDLRPSINRAKLHGCLKADDLLASLQVCAECSPTRP